MNTESVSGLSDFDLNQQKIIEALSTARFKWQAKERILEVTGLESDRLDLSLANLIEKGIVRPAFGKRDIVFGLNERVGKK